MRRLLHMMLKKNMAERASLSDILQDTELNTALQNPLDGQLVCYTALLNVVPLYFFFSLAFRALV